MTVLLTIIAVLLFLMLVVALIVGAIAHHEHLRVKVRDGKVLCTHKSVPEDREEADYQLRFAKDKITNN